MENMFSNKNSKRIPKSLNECVVSNATVDNLHLWAERLENWGNILLVILIIIGIVTTVSETLQMYELNEELTLVTCITSLLSWGLYAFLTYCATHAIALLISALANITQNTLVSANVALYEAAKNSNEYTEITNSTISSPSPATTPIPTVSKSSPTENTLIPTSTDDGEVVCPICGTKQHANRKVCWSCGQKFEVKEKA